jgi:hypothetical protein
MPEENPQQTQTPPQTQPSYSQPKVEYVVPDPDSSLFMTYANSIQLGFTFFDMRLIFGEIVDANPKKVIIEQRAQITISYLQAKFLMMLLQSALQQHEAQHGEIKLPPGAADAIEVTNAEVKMPATLPKR